MPVRNNSFVSNNGNARSTDYTTCGWGDDRTEEVREPEDFPTSRKTCINRTYHDFYITFETESGRIMKCRKCGIRIKVPIQCPDCQWDELRVYAPEETCFEEMVEEVFFQCPECEGRYKHVWEEARRSRRLFSSVQG